MTETAVKGRFQIHRYSSSKQLIQSQTATAMLEMKRTWAIQLGDE
jgi:hypothetical protein